MKPTLSKSQFIRGLQCQKSLWLYKYRPELRTLPDESQQAVFDTGTEVGLLAQRLFPGGVGLKYDGSSFDEKIEKTRELIESGVKTIYEATFLHDNVLVMVDILHMGENGWEIYEVKSSTEIKDIYLSDLAVQYFVLISSGLSVSKASLVYINNQYIRHGEIDVKALFIVDELSYEVKERQWSIKKELSNLNNMLSCECPTTDIGPHCSDPYDCDLTAHCWQHVPEYSVFDISRLNRKKKFDLYYRGVVEFKDIPEDYPLNASQRIQVDTELNGNEFINAKGIKEFLDTLHYPLYFLDFETFQSAIPMFEGTRPYEKIPFQYSLHSLEKEGAGLKHSEFLAEAGRDPREGLIKRLTSDIPRNACILAYNMAFEKGVIKALAEQFPAYADELMNIHDNIKDLMVPFQKKHWYTKEMKGSYSIKYVLPALVPELSYKGMTISNGGEAMDVYATLHLVEDKNEVERIREALLEYCRLDTLAMVRVLERLWEVGDNKAQSKKKSLDEEVKKVTREDIWKAIKKAMIEHRGLLDRLKDA